MTAREGHCRTGLPRRPGLTAGALTSFAFAVEAALGHRPMRYLIGRRFTGDAALTFLFVTEPGTLTGTHLWISEDPARDACEVWTRVPTMRRPVRVAERQIFGCLPLTEVGYLDLMAWRYPGLAATPEDRDCDLSWSRWPAAEARCHLGPPSTPGLTVTEALDPATGTVVARAVDRRGVPERRWEVVEPGGPACPGLPARIRVSRHGTGTATEFRRVGEPVPVPPGVFDDGPGPLRETLEHRLLHGAP